jgi:hypothetical protein
VILRNWSRIGRLASPQTHFPEDRLQVGWCRIRIAPAASSGRHHHSVAERRPSTQGSEYGRHVPGLKQTFRVNSVRSGASHQRATSNKLAMTKSDGGRVAKRAYPAGPPTPGMVWPLPRLVAGSPEATIDGTPPGLARLAAQRGDDRMQHSRQYTLSGIMNI